MSGELQLVLAACGALAGAIGIMWKTLHDKIRHTEEECAKDRAALRNLLQQYLHINFDDDERTES